MKAGHFACEMPKDLPENVKLIKGLFQDTVPKFVKENKNRSIFRKNIGRCLLNKDQSEYLPLWEHVSPQTSVEIGQHFFSHYPV